MKYKITFETINPFDVNRWKHDKVDDLYEWHEIVKEADSFNEIHQQLVQLMTWQSTREEPIRNVRHFKSETNWVEIKQEDLVRV